jgi:integrase
MYWQWRIRTPKEATVSYGTYPEVSLAEAREHHRKAQAQRRSGLDPNQEKRRVKAAKLADTENTFKSIAMEWHGTKKTGWSKTHTDKTLERMEKNLFPWLGARSLVEIEAPDLLKTLRRIENRGAINTAHRVKSIVVSVFRFAIATGRAVRNPAADVGVALKTTMQGHHPALTEPKQFGQLLRDIYSYSGSNTTRAALQIHALTFQRPGEIRGMAWAELDLAAGLWTIPPERMKNNKEKKLHGQPHLIPLSRQAVAVLKDLHPLTGHGRLVFPSERGQDRPISENTPRQALRSMGHPDHVPHGFRATARTLIREELHFDKEAIERQLSHGSDEELGGSYDRTQFLAVRKKMMQDWADYIDGLAERVI